LREENEELIKTQDHANISADNVSKMQALNIEQFRVENLRLREENEELITENHRLNTKLDQMRVFFQEALRNTPDSIN